MNTKNNRRAQETVERIVRAVYGFIYYERRPLNKITVREICEKAEINRSTFYAHFLDIYDVVEEVEKTMADRLRANFERRPGSRDYFYDSFVEMFRYIKEYREFYLIYFGETRRSKTIDLIQSGYVEQLERLHPEELGFRSHRELDYCLHFFSFGTSALLYDWLKNDCPESPEELYEILCRYCGGGIPFATGKSGG